MKTTMRIAIDPGKTGGVAVSFCDDIILYKCPETQVDMIELLRENLKVCEIEGFTISAVIEKVHAMKNDGKVSAWSFCKNYTTWVAGLIALDIPFEEVPPQQWMKKLGGVPSGGGPKEKRIRKNYIKDKMQKAYPKLKKDIILATSDALAMLHVSQK